MEGGQLDTVGRRRAPWRRPRRPPPSRGTRPRWRRGTRGRARRPAGPGRGEIPTGAGRVVRARRPCASSSSRLAGHDELGQGAAQVPGLRRPTELGQRAAGVAPPPWRRRRSGRGSRPASGRAATGSSRALVRASTARCDQGRPGRCARRSHRATAAASSSSSSNPSTTGQRPVGARRLAGIGPEHGPGGPDHLGRGPVVVVEAQDGGAGQELGEAVEEGGVGAVPARRWPVGGRPPRRGRAPSPSQALSRRHWAGLTSWNSSTKTWRMRHRWAAAATASLFEQRSRTRVTRSSRSSTLRRRLLVDVARRRPRRRRRGTMPSRRVATGAPRPPRRSRRGGACCTWAQWISASTAATCAGLIEDPSAEDGPHQAAGIVDHHRRPHARVGPVAAELGEGQRRGRSRPRPRPGPRAARGARAARREALRVKVTTRVCSARADPSRMRRATRRARTVVLPEPGRRPGRTGGRPRT